MVMDCTILSLSVSHTCPKAETQRYHLIWNIISRDLAEEMQLSIIQTIHELNLHVDDEHQNREAPLIPWPVTLC